MARAKLTSEQLDQEKGYVFPYHYLDVGSDEYKLIKYIPELALIRLIKDTLEPFKNQLILDAGCGDGRLCYELAKEKCKVIGVDFSERAINFAKAFNPNINFYVQNLKKLNLPYKFDSVVLSETLEHIRPRDNQIVLKNISTVLKKNGKFIITVPSINRPMQKKHYQHFSEKSLKSTLKESFKVIKVIGYRNMGLKYKLFKLMQLIGFYLFPFRYKIKIIMNYYTFLKKYYWKYLAVCDPRDGIGLIAMCIKRK